MKTAKLSRSERKFLHDSVRQVDAELRARFESTYGRWKEACQHPLLLLDSSPASRTHPPEFLELISLGPEILPLLMEKLTDPKEFFAVQAVDRLIRPQFVISREPGDPAILLGEQGRALETVKQWIKTNA